MLLTVWLYTKDLGDICSPREQKIPTGFLDSACAMLSVKILMQFLLIYFYPDTSSLTTIKAIISGEKENIMVDF